MTYEKGDPREAGAPEKTEDRCGAEGEASPHLIIPCRCSGGSKGLSRLAGPPTRTWSPPAVGSGSQTPPGGSRLPPCMSHYCCQEERLSLDSPEDRKRQRIHGETQGTRRAAMRSSGTTSLRRESRSLPPPASHPGCGRAFQRHSRTGRTPEPRLISLIN